MTLTASVIGLGQRGTVSTAISFEAGVIIHQRVSSSPAPVTAAGLRSAMPVRAAATGRQFRTRTTTTARGVSTSIRATTARTATTATTVSLFVLSKGLQNSERM
jgi:hypothetical protein